DGFARLIAAAGPVRQAGRAGAVAARRRGGAWSRPAGVASRPGLSHNAAGKPAMLIIDDLSIRVAGRLLLDHATARIAPGSRVGLVGRNGSGKSTLFNAIA